MKSSGYPSTRELLADFYGTAIAIYVLSVDTLPIRKADEPRNTRYSDANGHCVSALPSRFALLSTSQAAIAAGCRLCLIACNLRQFDEAGFRRDR